LKKAVTRVSVGYLTKLLVVDDDDDDDDDELERIWTETVVV
jgi:hypothetical protein